MNVPVITSRSFGGWSGYLDGRGVTVIAQTGVGGEEGRDRLERFLVEAVEMEQDQ